MLDIPQSVTVMSREVSRSSDAKYWRPGALCTGITGDSGRNNRDQMVIRGNSSSADSFSMEYAMTFNTTETSITGTAGALKGPQRDDFWPWRGRRVVNRGQQAGFAASRDLTIQGGPRAYNELPQTLTTTRTARHFG